MNSPITYYGGKGCMTDILLQHFPASYDKYVEGFGGGAHLLFAKKPDYVEIYNDIESNVYSVFKCISDETLYKELQKKLALTYYSREVHDECLRNLKNPNLSLLDRAYSFFYVCRTSFNGSGGFSSNYILRREFPKCISSYLSAIEGLEEVHHRLQSVIIENQDIFKLLDRYDDANTFFYLDPPYVHETRKSTQRYREDMKTDLHVKLVDRLLSIKGKVLISGYDHPIYDKLIQNGWNKDQFKSTSGITDSIETLWYNYNLINDNILF